VTGRSLIEIYAVGGAIIGLWAMVRFPTLAPSSMKGAIVAVSAAFVASCFIPLAVAALVAYGRAGGIVALLGLVLPVLTAMFWSAGCLFQALYGMLGRGT
jgi:hypothetical protein